jgi:Uma2 family endonuclease
MRLASQLDRACPEDLCVVPEPAVQLDAQTEFDPDLVVVPLDEVGGAKFTAPPLLVVEIQSPTRRDSRRGSIRLSRLTQLNARLAGRCASHRRDQARATDTSVT